MWVWVLLAMMGAAGLLAYLAIRHAQKAQPVYRGAPPVTESAPGQSSIYDNPALRWSGKETRPLALKTLTYRQFDCLDDARQGFVILADLPSGTSGKQGDRIRFHSPRTVESLQRHGFLAERVEGEEDNTFAITDHGLYAVEACSVRY